MPQQRVYFEYINEELVPYWYVLTFQPCEINWDKPVLYFEVIQPFEYIERWEFDESLLSTSIYLSDLIINPVSPTELGIDLRSIKNRILKHGVDPDVILQLIIQFPDIDDVLQLMPNERKMNLILS